MPLCWKNLVEVCSVLPLCCTVGVSTITGLVRQPTHNLVSTMPVPFSPLLLVLLGAAFHTNHLHSNPCLDSRSSQMCPQFESEGHFQILAERLVLIKTISLSSVLELLRLGVVIIMITLIHHNSPNDTQLTERHFYTSS